MADTAAAANAWHAGRGEPDVVGRDAAEDGGHAGKARTKNSATSSPSLAHDEQRDDESVASSSGTSGRRRDSKDKVKVGGKNKSKATARHPSQQQLRKSSSVSTTASTQSNISTEVRAAVSTRASRSALNLRPTLPTASPTTSYGWHHTDAGTSSTYPQGIGISYHQGPAPSPKKPPYDPQADPGGIVQVNPAPPPSPPPAHGGRGRDRNNMASSFLPFFGRRRPTSSASSTHASNFASANPPPPGPQAFDFNAILNSLDADEASRADIDAIAEICGRSRLSLANAHANHRGPVGELIGYGGMAGQYGGITGMGGLEPVQERNTPRSEEERRSGGAGSRAASHAGDERWPLAGGAEQLGDDRAVARQAARGTSGVAYGMSPRTTEQGRARRHLMRVRDDSGEREQRRPR